MTGVRPYRRPVNTVFQSYALFPHLDVFENVAFGLREAKVRQGRGARPGWRGDQPRPARGPRARRGRASSRAASSSGWRSPGRSINRPEVLLLDEPLGALDLKLRTDMQSQLKDLQRERRRDVLLRHPRPGRGVLDVRPRGRDEPRRSSSRWGRRRTSTTGPRRLFVADFVGTANRFAGRVARADGAAYEVDDRRRRRAPRRRRRPAWRPASRWSSSCVPRTCACVPAGRRASRPGSSTSPSSAPSARCGSHVPGLGELTSAARGAAAAPERGTLHSLAWSDEEAWLIPAETGR